MIDYAIKKGKRRRRNGRMKDVLFNLLNTLWNFGVTDGARTHDNRNHNPGLYQLSYSHHKAGFVWPARQESNL